MASWALVGVDGEDIVEGKVVRLRFGGMVATDARVSQSLYMYPYIETVVCCKLLFECRLSVDKDFVALECCCSGLRVGRSRGERYMASQVARSNFT